MRTTRDTIGEFILHPLFGGTYMYCTYWAHAILCSWCSVILHYVNASSGYVETTKILIIKRINTENQTDTLQTIEYSVRTVLCSWLLVTYWLAEKQVIIQAHQN